MEELTILKNSNTLTRPDTNLESSSSSGSRSPLDSGMLCVETSVFLWLDNVLSTIVSNSHIYYRHTPSTPTPTSVSVSTQSIQELGSGLGPGSMTFTSISDRTIQLDVVCCVLRALSCQLEALVKYQSDLELSTNFADLGAISLTSEGGSATAVRTEKNLTATTITSTTSTSTTNTTSGQKITNDLTNLRGICTQVLSKYRGAVLYLLSGDAVRETSRVRCGLNLLNSLFSPLGTGCGLWLPEVLRLLSQVSDSVSMHELLFVNIAECSVV